MNHKRSLYSIIFLSEVSVLARKGSISKGLNPILWRIPLANFVPFFMVFVFPTFLKAKDIWLPISVGLINLGAASN